MYLFCNFLSFLFQDFLLFICVIHNIFPSHQQLAFHGLKGKSRVRSFSQQLQRVTFSPMDTTSLGQHPYLTFSFKAAATGITVS